MVENIRSNDGGSPEGERRKTTVIREGPPRPEVRAAMGEEGRAPYQKIEGALARGSFVEGLAGTGAGVLMVLAILGTNALTLTAVGVIVLGGALFIGGGGIAAVAGQVSGRWRGGPVAVGGAALKALGGASAVAGGILVLVLLHGNMNTTARNSQSAQQNPLRGLQMAKRVGVSQDVTR